MLSFIIGFMKKEMFQVKMELPDLWKFDDVNDFYFFVCIGYGELN